MNDILKLINGDPGPFFENENSFFGKKQVDSSMKNATMQTDCGGKIITKSKMTYGEADELAAKVDLLDLMNYIRCNQKLFPTCYWKEKESGLFYLGEMWWVIYSFLANEKLIEGNPYSYNNSQEYLFNEILKKLKIKQYVATEDNQWYAIMTN